MGHYTHFLTTFSDKDTIHSLRPSDAICISKLGHHLFRQQLVTSWATNPYLKPYGLIDDWSLGNKFQWNSNQNATIFQARKSTWKYCLQNGSHFFSAPMWKQVNLHHSGGQEETSITQLCSKTCHAVVIIQANGTGKILLMLQCSCSFFLRKISGCACAGNAGNVFPATAGKRSRHASRHVRYARAVMHAGITN